MSPIVRSESYFIMRMPPAKYMSIGPTLVKVVRTTLNHLPAMLSLIFRLIILRLAFSYLSYSYFSLPKSLTRSWPLTDRVSFKMPLTSSFTCCDSLVSFHLCLPAFLVGTVKIGTMIIPTSAKIQFFWNIAIIAITSVIELDKILLKVFVTTALTPSMSLVILVMISPWLLLVKNFWLIFCRCEYIWFLMSNVMCCAIHVFMYVSATPMRLANSVTASDKAI